MRPTLQFDALHVVSDLHLGGFEDRKIFGTTAELVRLIDYVTSQAARQRVAFVINGDFVDFLAAKDARYFDPDGAVAKLDNVVKDFNLVFLALQRLTAASNACLIVNLGNHDLEFALPWVRERLLYHLSNDDYSARGRVRLELDGSGVLCQIANARVLCVHGNEVDDWNVADYEAIRRIGRDAQHGLPIKHWIPNAGAQLVVDVMNDIKRDKFPFVDLLKPETGGVVRALLALKPSLISKVPDAVPIAARRIWDGVRRATGFLGDEEGAAGVTRTFPPVRQMRVQARRQNYARALLDATEQRFAGGDHPVDLLGSGDESRTLGVPGAWGERVFTGDMAESLREALEPLAKDRSFNLFEMDDTYRDLDDAVSSDIDILIAGHTHLARVLPRRVSRGIYFNTGTWARLIKVTEHDLESRTTFKRFYDAFTAGTMQALDDAGVVFNRPTFASVWADAGAACAELRCVLPTPADPPFEPAATEGRAAYRKN